MSSNLPVDIQNADAEISSYYPYFVVRKSNNEYFVLKTKGLEDVDVALKNNRLSVWCKDVNSKIDGITFDWIFVEEEQFKKYKPSTFARLIKAFQKN